MEYINDEGKAQTVEGVRNYFKALGEKSATWGETLNDDQKNFASLIAKGGVEASIEVKNGNAKKISDKLIGIFFEDISYAADGGLYAEMVQNRDFEYSPKDHKGWHAFTAWRLASGSKAQIVNNKPLGKPNANALSIIADTLYNTGWDGMALKRGEKYLFSFYVNTTGKKRFDVAVVENGKVAAQTDGLASSGSVKTKHGTKKTTDIKEQNEKSSEFGDAGNLLDRGAVSLGS